MSGAARDSVQYTRSFAIKINAADTPMDDIANHPGIKFGDPHPDDPSVFATSFDCSVSDDLLLYRLNVTYQAPALIDASSDGPGSGGGGTGGSYDYAAVPADTWSGSSSVAAVPCTKDADIGGGGVNRMTIANTAGVGIPDLQKDQAYAQLQLTKSYGTLSTLITDIIKYTNKINSNDGWIISDDQYCWKCQGCNWQKVTQSSGGVNLTYFSATWVFAYDERQWKLEPLNVGYMDLSGGQGLIVTLAPILTPDGEQVTEPVALDEQGLADFDNPPKVSGRTLGEGWYVYSLEDLSYFGVPS